MPTIALATIPGFSDLQATALAAGKTSLGTHFSRMSSNTSFGLVRLEVFTGIYGHGDTVPVPKSTVDGYTYDRTELMYMWVPQNTADINSGWASFREPWTMWYGIWNVDQNTGVVLSEIGYRGNNDHKDNQATTNDGVLQVFTIAQRQKTKLILSAQPAFVRHLDADFFTDAPLTTGLLTDINAAAKYGVVNTEVQYMGEFFNGATVPQPVSPADGRTYAYSECIFLTSIRWTADTDGNNNPIKPAINKGQLQDWAVNVGPSGIVRIANTSVTYELNGQHSGTTGKVAVFAFCTRPLGTTFPTLQTSFLELVDSTFSPGTSKLRASTLLQLNRNVGQAVCTPEFFGPFDLVNGNTIALPTSPLDGYVYARSELMYIWDWKNTGPSVNTTGRLSLVHGTIDSGGVITVNDYRFNSGASAVGLVHEGTMRVLVFAKRSSTNAAPPVSLLGPPNFISDAIPDAYGNLDFIPDGLNRFGTLQAGTADSVQILRNPSFKSGSLTGWAVYDNLTSGTVSMSAVTDPTAPNTSGFLMRLTYSGAAGASPGLGGFFASPLLQVDSGAYTMNTYHKGATLVWRIRAKIPVGYTIQNQNNAFGTGGTTSWLTPQIGTGAYYDYVLQQNIGTAGSFSSIGFFNLIGPLAAIVMDVAMVSLLSLSAPSFGDLTSIPDGVDFVRGTAADTTYRPLTNPLTAQATGHITIAAFTMRISSRGDISLNSALLTGLTNDTLFYVYYDDPNIVGAALGAVTYTATTTQETALNGIGRFFVGSIRIPAASAVKDNIGNGDGGAGAQLGALTIFLANSIDSTGTSGDGLASNLVNAINPDFVTPLSLQITGNSGVNNAVFHIRTGFPGFGKKFRSLTLKILSQVPTNTINGAPSIFIQGPTGVNFFSLGAGVTRALTIDTFDLSAINQQNLGTITLNGNLSCGAASTTGVVVLNIYGIWIEGVE